MQARLLAGSVTRTSEMQFIGDHVIGTVCVAECVWAQHHNIYDPCLAVDCHL